MKYTLLPFQERAAADVAARLAKSVRNWRSDPSDCAAVSLSAITGAGKTVMATAVIEGFLRGNDICDADAGVTFLWVTDDPALNRQTRAKMLAASDRLRPEDVVIIDESFDAALLDPGKVYLLNVQKLGGSSSMIRRSDRRTHSLLETIRATATNPNRALVMVADEAHRGMRSISDRATIMQTLISTPMPVVWGISATLARFTATMNQMATHTMERPVVVNNADVRDSGLLKKTIVMQRPDARADLTTLRESVIQLGALDDAWREYCADEGIERVIPAIVVQVEDKISDARLSEYVACIAEAWTSAGARADLSDRAFAHVFAEHADITIGSRTIRYAAPESISADTAIRVIFAKTAITTGWDCPRAEVMCSLRAAKDETYIAQLLGRIVRTPLTRLIASSDVLNTVYAYLPRFDEAATASIISSISDTDSENDLGIEVTIDKAELVRNPAIDQNVFDAFTSLTSVVAPAKPEPAMKRAYRLASLLASHGALPAAVRDLENELHAELDGYVASHRTEMEAARASVRTVLMHTLVISDGDADSDQGGSASVDASEPEIEAAYEASKKVLGYGLHETYRAHLTRDLDDDDDEGFDEASVTVAALARIESMPAFLEDVCERIVTSTWESSAHARSLLTSAQRAEYDDIQASAGVPFEAHPVVPERAIAARSRISGGQIVALPAFTSHLLADASGDFPVKLNSWETTVVETEMARPGFVAWYRNPPSSGPSSLRIAVAGDASWTSMQPDFLFFYDSPSGIRVVIIDPHGSHLDDSAARMRAFVDYARDHGDDFARIEAVSTGTDRTTLRSLDLADERVCAAVADFDEPRVAKLFDVLGKDYR